jgi:peptidoglycan/LPS O-acetylase OafA/YrhL
VSKFPYYKSLDGVRGVAVLMVVLLHSRFLPIGWVGVQIFFVLSGFLITGILLTQTDKRFAVFLWQFYWRRGLRIWPLYFLYVAICWLAYSVIAIPENWPTARVPLVTFTYNIASISPRFQDSDYFGHFWTLCVEEQFYLVWPFLVFVLPQKHFRRFVAAIVLAGPILRFFTAMLFARYFNDVYSIGKAVHTMPFSHLDAFACGALIAVIPADVRLRLAPMASRILFAVLTLTITAGFFQVWLLWSHGLSPHWLALGYDDFGHFKQYLWGYSLLNLASAALIFCAMENASASRLLSFRPLVFVGVISFGLYVWHLPLLRVFGMFWPADPHSLVGIVKFATYLATSIGIASLSYFCFEKYFLRIKKRTSEISKAQAVTPVTNQ